MKKVLEDETIGFIFNNLRNFLLSVTVFSVGLYLSEKPLESKIGSAFGSEGILISMAGLFLILLNMAHAIKKITEANVNLWVTIPVAILYVIFLYRVLGVLARYGFWN